MKKIVIIFSLTFMSVVAMAQGAMCQQVGNTEIKAEFYTPSIVRVTKTPVEKKFTAKNLVVIAKPENVKVVHKGNTMSSEALTVKIDARSGAVTFLTAKGKTLLREKNYSFADIKEGSDAGSYRVTQVFS